MPRLLAFCLLFAVAACDSSLMKSSDPTETISLETSEGTMLAFDLSPRDSLIVFDLLGQLWTVPAAGGAARAITNAVRDTAEDLDPSFSPDGRSVVFRAERHGRTGLWLLDVGSGQIKQLTQVAHADEYQSGASWSPDGRTIAFTRVKADTPGGRWHSRTWLLDVATTEIRVLPYDSTQKLEQRDPVWSADGKKIAFVAASPANPLGGRIWTVAAQGGRAAPLSADTAALAPVFSPDGRHIAFLARDSAYRLQVWVQDVTSSSPAVRLTDHYDVASTRVRWTHDGNALVYSADGKLQKVAARGGAASTIPFTAHLAIERATYTRRQIWADAQGDSASARAFLGLGLSPDGMRIAAIALGKLWVFAAGETPRAIADVPFTARGISWSPDGNEVAWSAGPFGEEDLFAADLSTNTTRQLTALPGREALPSYSPDGRYLAFMHQAKEGALRVIATKGSAAVKDTTLTRNLGPGAVSYSRTVEAYPQWSPQSDALLVVGDLAPNEPTTATIVPLNGTRDTIKQFLDAPTFLQWQGDALTYLRHDRLWRASFDGQAVRAQPEPLGNDAALYASAANNGSLLYVSANGLRLRSASGDVRDLGWPISYERPVAPTLLIQNARIIDGKGNPASAPSDILIERGRISRIAAGGSITTTGRVIDAAGKFVMPGLAELHAHTVGGDLLPAYLYFGVTTIRDQGSTMAPLVAYADGVAAGKTAGPRVAYGGFQFYSDWGLDDEQGRGIEPEADPQHVNRSVSLAEAFGAQHIKTRTFRRWDINARMIAEAHRRGMRATGHCSAQLPLIAAGMDAKEHAALCSTRGAASPYALNDVLIYDDQVQLFRAAGVAVVPTISYMAFAARLSEHPKLLEIDSEVAPFISREDFGWMLGMPPADRIQMKRAGQDARLTAAKLARAGVTVGVGTDIWQLPAAVHLELEELVAAGLSPAEAIRAGTNAAARIIGAEDVLGSVETGKWADLLILDADPLADIRNTRRISNVIQAGHVVDRVGIRKNFKP